MNPKSENTKSENPASSKYRKAYTREEEAQNRFTNTDRDEASLGVSKERRSDPDLANESQPQWQPPESQPEPRPVDPVMDSPQQQPLPPKNARSNSPS